MSTRGAPTNFHVMRDDNFVRALICVLDPPVQPDVDWDALIAAAPDRSPPSAETRERQRQATLDWWRRYRERKFGVGP